MVFSVPLWEADAADQSDPSWSKRSRLFVHAVVCPMANVLIGLGSNLGSREENLRTALDLLQQTPGIDLRAVSRWIPTRPVGGPAAQPDFLNGAALLRTSLSPEHLLQRVQEIELQLGRVRAERWGPRPLDLDILLYEQLVVESPRLRIPHPAMAWRRFVLEPAAQVAGWMPHPEIGWTVRELFEHLRLAFPYVAITGPYPSLNRRLAQQVAQQTGAELVCVPGWLKVGLRMLAEKAKEFPIPSKQRSFLSPDSSDDGSWTTNMGGMPLGLAQNRGDCAYLEDAPWEEFAQPTQLAQDILQWLQVLIERLPSYQYRRASDGWVVSDFWLPQWLAEAAALLGPALPETDRRLWETLAKWIALPKLLVCLERQGDGNPGHPISDPQYLGGKYKPLGWQGPILRIRLARGIWPPRLSRAAAEVQTAMQAMQ